MNLAMQDGLDQLEALIESPLATKADRNEDTTRLQIIDTVLFSILKWDKADCVTEAAQAKEFADYVLSNPQQVLIVEAKREGLYFEIAGGARDVHQPLKPLLRGNPELKAALDQVCRYCQKRGVKYGLATNGHQWVGLVASRDDGTSPLDGFALVFSSLQEVKHNFLMFWNGFSREGVGERHLTRILLGQVRPHVPARLSASIYPYPGVKGRNSLQAGLQVVSELVLEDLPKSKELRERFLRECYCQSGALSQHSATAKNLLLARYEALFDSESPGPNHTPAVTKDGLNHDLLAESLSRRPILLVGDVGVGKTTFIDNLTVVEAKSVLSKSILLYVNLGSEATLTNDLRRYLLTSIKLQLRENYKVNIDADNFVRGVYHLELEQFAQGIYGRLKTAQPEAYLLKEIDLLASKTLQLDQHIQNSLEHLSRGRHHQIVLFIDNADQRIERDYEVQQQAFLIAEEIAKNWPVMVFLTLRPETFHRSLKTGSLSGYHPKAFTIAPPRIDEVLTKRMRFSQRFTAKDGELASEIRALSANVERIDTLLKIFVRSMQRNKELLRFIDNIASGNVRLALDMVRNFLGSGHVDTFYILEQEGNGEEYVIPVHQFFRAIAFGDYEHYSPDVTPIANLFDIYYPDPKEHFLRPLLLSILYAQSRSGAGFVEIKELYGRLQALGFVADQVDDAVIRCLSKKLLESSGRRSVEITQSPSSSLRITQIGAYHISELCGTFQYIDTILVDVPVLTATFRDGIKNSQHIYDRIYRCRVFCAYLDSCWRSVPANTVAWQWPKFEDKIKANLERVERSAKANQRWWHVD